MCRWSYAAWILPGPLLDPHPVPCWIPIRSPAGSPSGPLLDPYPVPCWIPIRSPAGSPSDPLLDPHLVHTQAGFEVLSEPRSKLVDQSVVRRFYQVMDPCTPSADGIPLMDPCTPSADGIPLMDPCTPSADGTTLSSVSSRAMLTDD